MSKEQEDQGFRVTDKRLFSETGEPRRDAAEPSREKQSEPEPKARPTQAAGEGPEEREAGTIDFPSYVLSYYTQGLVLLGEVPNPYTQRKEEDTEAARHTIDILALLQEKTRGNLTAEEGQLLESVLYELRLKYMAKTDRIKL
jgi:hypothetical protein